MEQSFNFESSIKTGTQLKDVMNPFLENISYELEQIEQQKQDTSIDSPREKMILNFLQNNKDLWDNLSDITKTTASVIDKFSYQKQPKDPVEQVPKEIVDIDAQLAGYNSHIKLLQMKMQKLKDSYNGLGDNAEKIRNIENKLVDLERQKNQLKDVLNSHTRYISKSQQILTSSTNATVKQEKIERVKQDILEEKMKFRDLDKKLKQDEKQWNLDFQNMVEVHYQQQYLKESLSNINNNKSRSIESKHSQKRPKDYSKQHVEVQQKLFGQRYKEIGKTHEMMMNRITDMQDKIRQLEQENLENEEEIKQLTGQINPKLLEIMQFTNDKNTDQNDHRFLIFKRNYSKPKVDPIRNQKNKRYLFDEVNKSVDFYINKKRPNFQTRLKAANESVIINDDLSSREREKRLGKKIIKNSGIDNINSKNIGGAKGEELTVIEKEHRSKLDNVNRSMDNDSIQEKIRYEEVDNMNQQDEFDKAQVIPKKVKDQYIQDDTKKK